MATPIPPQPGRSGDGAAGGGDPASGVGGRVARGRLLVATPMLEDPNFDRTVLVVLEHDEDGTLGLVLNRPTPLPVAEVVSAWATVAEQAPPAVVFAGGPVSPQVAVGLARVPPGGVAAGPPVVDDVQVVDLSRRPPGLFDAGSEVDRQATPAYPSAAVRVFAGYAGWGPGQLADELASGAWYVVDGRRDDVVGDDPEGLWRRVLRRQQGSLRLLASFPADPADN